ncbi:carnitine O-palmitoyltransferase 1, liver isoform [Elysia marginata]|uniref:Carnitine O-palmitoyltransferase 1, liver isoform n=1 Tax=Elysia marginata TaxID=1093978 RepID=A0AAV4EN63_9GAST|nr:carnitine O-palmitoyltransferase 1, liver isoform [Elysia marginata]
MAQLWETIQQEEYISGYDKDGHTRGTPEVQPPNPIRLEWDINKQCQQVIESSLQVAKALANDVDLHIMMFTDFGKGFVKTCKVSPDAFIQASIQLTYYRLENHFCLTYESSMTRLFREGRTETVRSCTAETCAFARAVCEKKPKPECIKLMRDAAEAHQQQYRDTMTGAGIDRHLFCLYVVSKYLGVESPFLAKALMEPWKLSTSQVCLKHTTTSHTSPNHVARSRYPLTRDMIHEKRNTGGSTAESFHNHGSKQRQFERKNLAGRKAANTSTFRRYSQTAPRRIGTRGTTLGE